MRVFSTLALVGCFWLALGSQAFADVQISIHDGRVSLVAKDATVRQILTEWARVGRTTIVNVERITGGPITIEFTNVPEQEALDTLLRSLSGYMAAQRTPVVSDASQFDRIIVMPTTAVPRAAASATAPPQAPPPPFAQLNGLVQPTPDEDDQNNRLPGGVQLPPALAPIFNNLNNLQPPQPGNPRRPGNTGSPGPGIFGTIPQNDPQLLQSPNGAAPPTPVAQPVAAPYGAVSAPGMIAPAPQQPGQIVPPGVVPGQPQRRSPND